MTGPDRTGLFLLVLLGINGIALWAWECYALYWLEEGSTISHVLGGMLKRWPPLLILVVAFFLLSLWHFWEVGEP